MCYEILLFSGDIPMFLTEHVFHNSSDPKDHPRNHDRWATCRPEKCSLPLFLFMGESSLVTKQLLTNHRGDPLRRLVDHVLITWFSIKINTSIAILLGKISIPLPEIHTSTFPNKHLGMLSFHPCFFRCSGWKWVKLWIWGRPSPYKKPPLPLSHSPWARGPQGRPYRWNRWWCCRCPGWKSQGRGRGSAPASMDLKKHRSKWKMPLKMEVLIGKSPTNGNWRVQWKKIQVWMGI